MIDKRKLAGVNNNIGDTEAKIRFLRMKHFHNPQDPWATSGRIKGMTERLDKLKRIKRHILTQ